MLTCRVLRRSLESDEGGMLGTDSFQMAGHARPDPQGVNCCPTCDCPLMIWVMGSRQPRTGRATTTHSEMQRLLHEAMDAGACGWSTQRLGENSVQADYDGTPMVTDIMSDNECLALAEVLRERDEGFIQITQATGDIKSDLAFEAKLAEVSGRPILHNVIAPSMQRPDAHTKSLKWLHECNDRGERIFGQAFTIRSAFAYTLEDWNLYDSSPAWNYATTGTIEEKMAKFADPEVRERLKAEMDDAIEKLGQTQAIGGSIEKVMIQHLEAMPELEEFVGLTLAQVGEKMGKPRLTRCRLAWRPTSRPSSDQGPTPTRTTWPRLWNRRTRSRRPPTGGATQVLTAGSYRPISSCGWSRDTGKITRGSALPSLRTSRLRRRIHEPRALVEAPADVVVYDLDELKLEPSPARDRIDFPGGEWRSSRSRTATSGIPVSRGQSRRPETGATPGKLLRHGRR